MENSRCRFPSNLEDGEKWLPSDVFNEITAAASPLHHFNSQEYRDLVGGQEKNGKIGRKQYEGTGYFHPKISHVNINKICKTDNNAVTKGTGVYHQPPKTTQPMTNWIKNSTASKSQETHIDHQESEVDQVHVGVSQEIGILLPQEWTY